MKAKDELAVIFYDSIMARTKEDIEGKTLEELEDEYDNSLPTIEQVCKVDDFEITDEIEYLFDNVFADAYSDFVEEYTDLNEIAKQCGGYVEDNAILFDDSTPFEVLEDVADKHNLRIAEMRKDDGHCCWTISKTSSIYDAYDLRECLLSSYNDVFENDNISALEELKENIDKEYASRIDNAVDSLNTISCDEFLLLYLSDYSFEICKKKSLSYDKDIHHYKLALVK